MDRIDWENPVSDHPLNQGLVSWWLAGDENPYWGGAKFLDLCERNHGTLSSMDPATDWLGSRGRPGGWGSLDFDGTNDYVNCGHSASLNLESTTPRSISWWMIQRNVTADVNIISKQQNAGSYIGWGVNIRVVSGYVSFFLYNGTALQVEFPSAYLDGLWHHFTVTYNGSMSASGVSGWVDGAQVSLNTNGDNLSGSTLHTDAFSLSARGNGAANYWNGVLDDVQLRNRVVSSAEARAIFDLSRQGYPGLLNRLPKRFFFSSADTGTETTPDPVSATWSTVAPGKSLAVTPDATGATWSAVAPVKSLSLAQSPAAATWTPVQPSVSVTISASPASATWSTVEPSTGAGQFATPDPVVSTWTVVAPSLSLSRSVQPASVTWQARAVGSKQLTLATSPASVQWSQAAPAVALLQTPSPAGVQWSTPAPGRALVGSVSAVSATWAVPAVTVGDELIVDEAVYFKPLYGATGNQIDLRGAQGNQRTLYGDM